MDAVAKYGYEKIRRLASYTLMSFDCYKKKVDYICNVIAKMQDGKITIDEAAKLIAEA